MRTAAVVLAGGRSERMGVDKAGLAWGRSTLLAHVVGIVAAAVDRVVVVGSVGTPLPDLPPGVQVAVDAVPGRGPMEGLLAGLRAVGPEARVFVTATDMPFLTPERIAAALEALTPGVDAAVPYLDGFWNPLAGAYRSDLADDVARFLDAGERGLQRFLATCRVTPLTVDDPTDLTNLNTPADYATATKVESGVWHQT